MPLATSAGKYFSKESLTFWEENNEHLDNLIRDPAGSVDRGIHGVPRGKRAHPSTPGIRDYFVDFALRDG